MHFYDSFIAHFFPVLSLSCCHKQTSAVLLLFIIHKSNKVASQDGARRHSRGVLHHDFLLLRPLSISISSFVSGIHLTASSSFLLPACLPAVSADSRKWKRRRPPAFVRLLSPKFLCAARASLVIGKRKSNVTVHSLSRSRDEGCARQRTVDNEMPFSGRCVYD